MPRPRLTYANVVATLALFLALGGGVVWAGEKLNRNAVKSHNIAANAVKTRNIAANAVRAGKLARKSVHARHLAAGAVRADSLANNAVANRSLAPGAVSADKVQAGTLTRQQLAAGTLPGLQVLDMQAPRVPGLAVSPAAGGDPLALEGANSFVPAEGKSYLLLVELRGDPIDGDGPGGNLCQPSVFLFVNGEAIGLTSLFATDNGAPPFNRQEVDAESIPVGLLEAGQTQTVTARVFGDPNCGAGTSAALRAVVIAFG